VATGRTPQRPINNQISDAHWDLIQQCFSPLDASPPRPTTDEILTFLEKPQLEGIMQIIMKSACNMFQSIVAPETLFSGQSDSPAPPSDKKGKKRAIAESDVTSASLRERSRTLPIQQSMYSTSTKGFDVGNMWKCPHPWPIQESMYSMPIKSDGDAGVKEIVFSSDGECMAVVCSFLPFLFLLLLGANLLNVGHDRTIRIWSALNRIETARLAQNSAIVSVAWMADDSAVITLGQDGVVSKWTRNVSGDVLVREFGLD
jgi:WD40 repeat protein